jgi:hypothetical protein
MEATIDELWSEVWLQEREINYWTAEAADNAAIMKWAPQFANNLKLDLEAIRVARALRDFALASIAEIDDPDGTNRTKH